MNLSEIKTKLEQYKGRRQQTQTNLLNCNKQLKESRQQQHEWEYARTILQTVVKQTQETLSYRIGEMGSLALEAIFDDPYKVNVDFVPRRGRTEADIWFERKGTRFGDPLNEIGGGSCDSGALGLVFSMWSLRVPRTRKLMLFDEPFRNLDRYEELERAKRASALVKRISKKNGIQIIMVTHNEHLVDSADKVIDLTKL